MSRETRRFYDLGGDILEVTTSGGELLACFDRAYGDLRSATEQPGGFTLELLERPLPEPPAHLPLVFDGDVPVDGHCRLYVSDGETFLIFPDRAALSINRENRRGRITVTAGAAEATCGAVGVAAIEAVADSAGQVMMHAAALTLPGERRCILIHAPSGTGKTTTTLALIKDRFGLCSDDAAFLKAHNDGFSAWGFPSDLKVHRKTAPFAPWLAPALTGEWDAEGEQPVTRAALAAYGRVENYEPRPVAALFRLVRSAGDETEIVPIRRADILMSLAADNLYVGLTGLLPIQKRRFEALARLAAAAPVLEIRAGGNLTGLGAAITAALGKRRQPVNVS
jgi:hypothetical protein